MALLLALRTDLGRVLINPVR